MTFWSSKKKSGTKNEAVVATSGPVLRITVGKTHIANLFHDGQNYCLEYTLNFASSGLAPFNPNDIPKGTLPEVNRVYRCPELWQVFASRIPSPARDDFKALMTSMGLDGSESPLVILGKVGRVSISKPWKLELVVNNKTA